MDDVQGYGYKSLRKAKRAARYRFEVGTEKLDGEGRSAKVIYFIRNTKSGYIKIGLAANAEARLRNLQTGADYRLELLAIEAGGRARERALHKKFDDLRVRSDGEWFRPGPELTRYVALLAAKTGARREAIETGRAVVVRPAAVEDRIFGEETT